jgi:hypothetical protein
MIKSITVYNHLDESIQLELAFPEKSGFAIQQISGLGPVKATINTADFSTMDGSIYNSARISARNIVMTLIFLDNPNVETMRQLSYKYFPIKKRIKLVIETDNRLAEIYGYVESNEPVIFSQRETTQISIICPNPYFYSSGLEGEQLTIFSGFEKRFQFPWSNESVTEKLIETGVILKNQTQTVYYQGDGDVGINIEMVAMGSIGNITIANLTTGEVMILDSAKLESLTGSAIVLGDELYISTIKGQKSIILLRNGEYINIINCLDKDVSWFQLVKGDNVFHFDADEGVANLAFRIKNKIIYEGV